MHTNHKPLTATLAEHQPMLALVSNGRAAPPSALSPALREKLDHAQPAPRRNHREAALQAQLQAHLARVEPDRTHVDKPDVKPQPEPERKAMAAKKKKAGGRPKLSDEKRAEMVKRLDAGERAVALAKEYGLTESGVYYARARARASNGATERTPRGMKGMDLATLAKELAEATARVDKIKRAMRKALGS